MAKNDLRSNSDDEISVKDIFIKIKFFYKYLINRWKLILLISILCSVLGLLYAIFKKPVYKAELNFALEDSKSAGGLGAYSGLASQFGLDVGGAGGAFSGDNLIELMKSRLMVEKTLLTPVNVNGKSETLAQLYIDFNGLREKWANNPEIANVNFIPGCNPNKFSLKQDSILFDFYNKLISSDFLVDKVDKKLSFINVNVTSKNELFAKYFTEVLVNNVSAFYIETKTKKYSHNVEILQHQTDSVRQELNNAISGVAASTDINPNANPNRQILRTPALHRQVDVQVNTAILSELVKNLEVAKVSLRNETPLVQIIDKPILPLEVKKVGKLKGGVMGFMIGFLIVIMFVSVKRMFQIILTDVTR